MSPKSATWKAVTAFRKTRKKSLYHAVPPQEEPEEKPVATFTSAAAVAPPTPTSEPESEDQSPESE